MRLAKFPVVLILLSTIILFSSSSAQEQKENTKYFEVKAPIANVYKALDPKSEIIKQVMVGERLEVIGQGTSWHNVMIDSKSGWIENQAGKIVSGKKGFPVFSVMFLLVLMGGTAAFVFMRINSAKTTETEEV
ncbi:MAG TPA: hypothetical protein VHP36_07310 [Chitinispirillaceae bacterium]|nr:hypothetical protein [Chitinispirillaceae bacterium]